MNRELEIAASKLLRRAAQAGVYLSYSHEKLQFKLAVEVFPQELKTEIVANKAALLALLKKREPHNSSLRSSRIQPRPRETNELPTSFAQQRLWFIDQLNGGSPQYNMPGGLRIRGRFDEDIAESVLRRIIQRHEPLRTVFRKGTEGPLQHIRENFDFHLTRLDLSALPAEEQEQIVLETVRADALKPFDLSADLMLRASFVRLSEDEGVLLFNMHHIASDGWSMRVLVKEFREFYDAFPQTDPLPPLNVHYADYAQWQREWLAGEILEQQLHYWEEQLAGLPQVHALPLDRSRPAVQTFNGAVHSCTMDRATLAGLKQIARQEQVTLFMMLHGLFALLLSRHSNSDDIVIGTGVANRPQPELEPLVGFFVNMLVLRSDCRPGCTFREFLAHIKSVNLNAQANQDVPLEYLVERLKPQRSVSHTPLFQIAFTLNQVETSVAQLPELEFTPLEIGPVRVKFDLVLEALEMADDLRLNFTYNTDLFEEQTIARLGEHLQNLARGVVADAGECLERLPLLSESERRHLLYELNETAADYPRESCLHELFEAHVELRPDAVAVVFADRQLSYRELNERANQLAHYLREQGVGPDTLVGLCVDRSLAMVVGLLGILKAGGAYVPIDPRDPAERLEYIIADSSPALVLTQELLEHRLPFVPRLRLDADKELLRAYPTHNPRRDEVGLTPEHLAYVIYSSGSTDRPNGVMGLHRSTLNRLSWKWKASPLLEPHVRGQKSSVSFVDSVCEIFGPLLAGAPLVIIPTADVKDARRPEKVSNLTHPIANTQIYILDESMQPVPVGVIGEIYVAGDNLGRGYLRDPELTAERFLPCPYSRSAGARMYRTRDFGRWLRDGSIEHVIEQQTEDKQPLPAQPELLTTNSMGDHAEAILLTAPAGLDLWLHSIVRSIYQQHAPHASSMVAESCVIETLPEDPGLHADFVSERCGFYQHSLETTDGPIFRAVYLQARDQGPSYLFVVTHRTLADVSWRVLLRDLDDAYRQLHARGSIQFAAQESSYKQWGEAHATNGKSDALQPRMDQQPTSRIRTMPLELTTAETAALLNDCTAAYQLELNELLLAAVYLALRQWSGQSSVRITLEEHDSEDLFPEIDVAEIVGCFITTYPLLLNAQDGAIFEVVKTVKDQFRATPRYGMGYGLLGDAAHDVLSNAALLFNQQSDFSQLQKTVSVFALGTLCVDVEVATRALRLRLDYDEDRYSEETIAALARSIEEAFRALVARSRSVDPGSRGDAELKEGWRVMKWGES